MNSECLVYLFLVFLAAFILPTCEAKLIWPCTVGVKPKWSSKRFSIILVSSSRTRLAPSYICNWVEHMLCQETKAKQQLPTRNSLPSGKTLIRIFRYQKTPRRHTQSFVVFAA